MMRPRAAFRCGSAACATRNGARVLVWNIASHCSTGISSMGAVSNRPALFTRMSMRPNSAATRATVCANALRLAQIRVDGRRADAQRLKLAHGLRRCFPRLEIGNGHVRAFSGQRERGRAPNPLGRARHQRHFALQTTHIDSLAAETALPLSATSNPRLLPSIR